MTKFCRYCLISTIYYIDYDTTWYLGDDPIPLPCTVHPWACWTGTARGGPPSPRPHPRCPHRGRRSQHGSGPRAHSCQATPPRRCSDVCRTSCPPGHAGKKGKKKNRNLMGVRFFFYCRCSQSCLILIVPTEQRQTGVVLEPPGLVDSLGVHVGEEGIGRRIHAGKRRTLNCCFRIPMGYHRYFLVLYDTLKISCQNPTKNYMYVHWEKHIQWWQCNLEHMRVFSN